MPEQYPTASFRFSVEIGGDAIGAFTECQLPSFEITTQEIQEGGQNDFTHTLSGPAKVGHVTLKHGIMIGDQLMKWYFDVMNNKLGADGLKPVTVTMYNTDHSPLYRFHFDNAYPVKWQGPSFNSGDNAVAIESLELAHQGVSVS